MRSVRTAMRGILFMLAIIMQANGQYVFINQAGYLPDQKKLVYACDDADSFCVVDAVNGAIRFRGRLVQSSTKDAATGLFICTGDFSPLNQDGTYKVTTSSSDTSFTFRIAYDVFDDVFRKSLKGFYFQRCGTALLSRYAGQYARGTCHTNDALYHSSTGRSGSKLVTGGWHDAGDYGKYVVSAGITAGTLMMAYEMFPARVGADDLNIPESGNSVPDILDEVRYELDWLLEMQDPADGGVYFKVTPTTFEGFVMPEQALLPRYIYRKSTAAAGDFAAVMAMAARTYRPFDTSFSSKCLNASKLAWQYLEANSSIVPAGGFTNPSGTNTGEYGDSNDADERLWAAAELFASTGSDVYKTYFSINYNAHGLIGYAMDWRSIKEMAQTEYLRKGGAAADSTVKSQIMHSLQDYCNKLVSIASADGFKSTLALSDYYWGSNSVALNNAALLIVGYTLTGNPAFYNTALAQLNYVLGCNMHDMSFVTGVGAKSPRHIHHRPSASDGIADPVPGLIAGGPDANITNDPVLAAAFTKTTPPAACYVDDQGSYASNEIAINWNAPLVFVAGFFNESPGTSVNFRPSRTPSEYLLGQNFPNPFNPSTVVPYNLPLRANVKLCVYDILGRKVRELNQGIQGAGSHSVIFDAAGLPSGVYICSLNISNGSDGRVAGISKMVLVR